MAPKECRHAQDEKAAEKAGPARRKRKSAPEQGDECDAGQDRVQQGQDIPDPGRIPEAYDDIIIGKGAAFGDGQRDEGSRCKDGEQDQVKF